MTGNPIDLEPQYNNRAAVPDHPVVMARWKAEAETARVARPPLELAYGDRPREVMDLWEAAPDAPVAVFIHGGYWQALDKGWFSWIAPPLLAQGISVAIPSYDLCPEVSLSRIVHQMRAVADLLKASTGARPFVFGHSAGGHLAACLLSEGRASGALAISGVFDLEPLIPTSLNTALGLDALTARALSPIYWPPPNGGAPGGTSLDCIVGAAETAEFIRQSRAMADLWASKGVETRFEALDGLNHFTVLDPLADADSGLVRRIVERVKQ
ncbi:MAG: alpha/beta hydrolase [Brevundimonas sp.]|uniref:alpha/beta hydrolase n=1 Tax=Brevundimonas sp. TaxID=1871086 RepID=UPI0040335D0F